MKWVATAAWRSGIAILLLAGAPAQGFEDVDGTFGRLTQSQRAGVRELLDLILRMGRLRASRPCGSSPANVCVV